MSKQTTVDRIHASECMHVTVPLGNAAILNIFNDVFIVLAVLINLESNVQSDPVNYTYFLWKCNV